MSVQEQECSVQVAGERLILLPERAALWEARDTLIVADAHWGKAATFRAEGIPVPRGTTADGLARLDAVLSRHRVRRIVFLGDYQHARQGRSPDTLAALEQWSLRHPGIEQVLIRGNHDRHAGDPPPELGVRCVDPPLMELPFVLAHHPDPSEAGYVLAGHVHPAVRLVGKGRQRERLPCFWFGAEVGVLPAFGDFTGAAVVQPAAGDRVFVLASDRVMEIEI
jgi:DNA ligase-associated metallophosphoesterase